MLTQIKNMYEMKLHFQLKDFKISLNLLKLNQSFINIERKIKYTLENNNNNQPYFKHSRKYKNKKI